MATTKPRVNLTVNDNLYEILREKRHEMGFTSMAETVLHLVEKGLVALDVHSESASKRIENTDSTPPQMPINNGLKFINMADFYNRWSLETVRDIVVKVYNYAIVRKGLKNVELAGVEDMNYYPAEKNERYNIRIRYTGDDGQLWEQWLVMLNGEVLDGAEFHKRLQEFYPREV